MCKDVCMYMVIIHYHRTIQCQANGIWLFLVPNSISTNSMSHCLGEQPQSVELFIFSQTKCLTTPLYVIQSQGSYAAIRAYRTKFVITKKSKIIKRGKNVTTSYRCGYVFCTIAVQLQWQWLFT